MSLISMAIWWTIADKLLINLAWKKKIISYTHKAYYVGKSNVRMSTQYVYITSTSFRSNRFVQNCWINNKGRILGSTLPVSWYAILRGIANIGVVANYSFAQVCNYHPSLLSHAWSCFRLMFFWSADLAKRSSGFCWVSIFLLFGRMYIITLALLITFMYTY